MGNVLAEVRRCPVCNTFTDREEPNDAPLLPDGGISLRCGDRVEIKAWDRASRPTLHDPIALVVTGSRKWMGVEVVRQVFGPYLDLGRPVTLLHGKCSTGLDAIADRLARSYRWQVVPMPAQWAFAGNAAGPTRNAAMATVAHALQGCGYQVVVYGFPLPDSKGTWGAMRCAVERRLDVRVVKPDGTNARWTR